MLPEVVVYWDANYGGAEFRTNLAIYYVGDNWNDQISSVVVVSGTWTFYENANFNQNGGAQVTVGPGYYSFVENGCFGGGMQNDSISSFQPVSDQPQGSWPTTSC
jgi:hypothetical protein